MVTLRFALMDEYRPEHGPSSPSDLIILARDLDGLGHREPHEAWPSLRLERYSSLENVNLYKQIASPGLTQQISKG